MPDSRAIPTATKTAAFSTTDFNGNCVIDGRRQENVYWTATPPSGHYIARVDTYSMCGTALATWHVAATLSGQSLGLGTGFSHDTDAAYFAHGAGAGLTALEFDIP